MTRAEIVAMFRRDNPAITKKVASDSVVHDWLLVGDKDFCVKTRCIVTDFAFNSVVTTSVYSTRYDLTAQNSKFYDIDDSPGGGVSFDDEPLDEKSPAELDEEDDGWRTADAGTPEAYYRRGKWLYFDTPVETADLEIRVYATLISDDFDNDSKTPFNQLAYLEPFHSGLLLYLKYKGKAKKGKPRESQNAMLEYIDYCKWVRTELGGGRHRPIQFRPLSNAYNPQ